MRIFRICYATALITNLGGCGDPIIKDVHAMAPPIASNRVPSPLRSIPNRVDVPKSADDEVDVNLGTRGPPVPALDYSEIRAVIKQRKDILASVASEDRLAIAKKFYDEYFNLLEELIQAEKKPHRDIDPDCPPQNLKVTVNGVEYDVPRGDYIAHGSSSRVFRSPPIGARSRISTSAAQVIRLARESPEPSFTVRPSIPH